MYDFIDRLLGILSPVSWYRALVRLRRDLADWCDIRVTSPLAVLAGLNCVAGLILVRAHGGGATIKLSDARLCTAAGAAAGLAIASRWALSNCQRADPAFWIKSLLAAFSVLPLAALFTVATPRNSLLAIGVVSALALVAGNANLFWKRKSPKAAAQPGTASDYSHGASAGDRQPDCPPTTLPVLSGLTDLSESHERPRLAEWCERSTDEFGNTVVLGSIVARFEPGQSLATVHVAFQPPFDRVPEFSFEVLDAALVRVRTPAVFRYGARLELKRSEAIDAALQTPLRFQAVSQASTLRAA